MAGTAKTPDCVDPQTPQDNWDLSQQFGQLCYNPTPSLVNPCRHHASPVAFVHSSRHYVWLLLHGQDLVEQMWDGRAEVGEGADDL